MRIRLENSTQYARKPGSSEPYFNTAGEMNAGSKKDAIEVLAMLLQDVASGRVHTQTENEIEAQRKRRELSIELASSWHDHSSKELWADVGAAISLEITEVLNRLGLMRKVYVAGDVQQGAYPRIRVRTRNVTAVVANGVGAVNTQYIRDRFVEPPEFYISANPRVTEIDIAQGASDLLEDVFLRAQEAIVVGEDRTWFEAVKATAGVANDFMSLTGGLQPSNLATMRQQVARWNLSPTNIIVGTEAASAFMTESSGFSEVFDPVTQNEVIRTGTLGVIWGMQVHTDGFRLPEQKVIGSRDVIITSDPVTHGGYSDRGGVVSTPVDGAYEGVPSRGWFMYELMSQALVNPKSVVWGTVS